MPSELGKMIQQFYCKPLKKSPNIDAFQDQPHLTDKENISEGE